MIDYKDVIPGYYWARYRYDDNKISDPEIIQIVETYIDIEVNETTETYGELKLYKIGSDHGQDFCNGWEFIERIEPPNKLVSEKIYFEDRWAECNYTY